jgi:predicted CopG family antitoxin
MDLEKKDKTIKITSEVHSELVKLGLKNDSFDDIIMRLIKEHYERDKGRK